MKCLQSCLNSCHLADDVQGYLVTDCWENLEQTEVKALWHDMEKWPGRSLNVFHYQASCDKLRTPQFGWMCDSQSRGGEGGRAGCTAGFEEAHKRHSPICFRNKICIISGCLQSPKFALLGKKLLIFSTNLELNLHISQKETQAAVDEHQCWSCRTDRAQGLPRGTGGCRDGEPPAGKLHLGESWPEQGGGAAFTCPGPSRKGCAGCAAISLAFPQYFHVALSVQGVLAPSCGSTGWVRAGGDGKAAQGCHTQLLICVTHSTLCDNS